MKTDSTPSMISYYSVLYQNNRNISLTAIRSSGTLCIIKELYLFIYQLEWIFGVGVLKGYWGLGFLLVPKQEDLGQDGGYCDHTHSYQYRQTLQNKIIWLTSNMLKINVAEFVTGCNTCLVLIFFLKKLNRKHEKGKAIWYMPVQGHAYNMCIVYKFPVHISCKFEFLVLEESCFTSNYMYKRCKCSFYWSDDDLLMRNYYEVNIHDKWMFDRRSKKPRPVQSISKWVISKSIMS